MDIYGVRLNISAPPDLIKETAADFRFFSTKTEPFAPEIQVEYTSPATPPGSSFRYGSAKWSAHRLPDGRRLVIYPQGASCLCDYAAEKFELKTPDFDLARELLYLLILSRAGEALDKRGQHRLHAGAVALNGRPLLFCCGQGGGKTTLLLELLKDADFSLLSDDTPLVGTDGIIFPFPLRFGLAPDSPHLASYREVRLFRRRYHREKFLLDHNRYGWKISAACAGAILFSLRKSSAPGFKRMPRVLAWGELLRSLVVGYGVPQMAEYFLRWNIADLADKSRILLSRLKAARALLAGREQWIFQTGPCPADNAAALKEFMNGHNTMGPSNN